MCDRIQRCLRAALLSCAPMVALLAGCATAPESAYVPPGAGVATAEVELRLMGASRHRSAALLVPGAPSCNTLAVSSWVVPSVEAPARVIAGSWEQRDSPVVRLPADTPLPLRFRYQGPGEMFVTDAVVVLQPGQRYIFEHEIPGRRYTLTDAVTGQPATTLAPDLFHTQRQCRR